MNTTIRYQQKIASHAELYRRHKNGDKHATDKLVGYGLATFWAMFGRGEFPASLSRDELIDAAHWAVIKALGKYNPKKNVKFSTYCAQWIWAYAKKAQETKIKFAQQHMHGLDGHADVCIPDDKERPDELLARLEDEQNALSCLSELTKNELDVINLRYLTEVKKSNQDSVANTLGFGRTKVHNLEKSALRKLAEVYKAKYGPYEG